MTSLKSLLPLFTASALTQPACAITTEDAQNVGPNTKILHIVYSDGATTKGPEGSADPCRDASAPPAFSCATGPLETCQKQIEDRLSHWLRHFDVTVTTALAPGEEADYTAIVGGTNRVNWCGLPETVTGYADINCKKRLRQTFYVVRDGASDQALLLAHEFGHVNGLVHDAQDPVTKKVGIMYPALINLPEDSIYPSMALPAVAKNHCGRVMQNEYEQMMSALEPSKDEGVSKEIEQTPAETPIILPGLPFRTRCEL